MVAPRGGDHHDLGAHLGSQPDAPGAILVAADIGGVLDGLVAALHGEAVIGGGQVKVCRGVAQAEAVVEPALALLADHEFFLLIELFHGDRDVVVLGAAPLEVVLAGKVLAEPGARDEVGLLGLEDLEVAVQALDPDAHWRTDLHKLPLLEDDDLVGAYGHHWLAEVRPAIPPPARCAFSVTSFPKRFRVAERSFREAGSLAITESSQAAASRGIFFSGVSASSSRAPARVFLSGACFPERSLRT